MATDPHAEAVDMAARFNARHSPRSLQYKIVHLGFWAALVLAVCMIVNMMAPELFESIYIGIGVAYLMLELAMILARDPLNWGEVFEGHVFSGIPAVGGLIFKSFDWLSTYGILTPAGRSTMNFWLIIAWICFGFGIAMSVRILSTQYRRDESRTPPS